MAKKEANKKENSKNKKSFFKDFKAELKKVVWLTPKQLVNNTLAVITIVIITAVIVLVLDLAFQTINEQGLDRLKENIKSSIQSTESEENTTGEENTENSNTTEGNSEDGATDTGSEENTENTENSGDAENTENTANETSSEDNTVE